MFEYMLRVPTEYQSLGVKPVNTLSAEQARAQPTPGDAAAQLAARQGVPTRQPVASVSDIAIPGSIGSMPARVYDSRQSTGPAQVILYFHGDDWVTGTLDTYDGSCRILADQTGAIVVSVQYDLGLEHRFPTAQDDADKRYNWLLNKAASLGGDPDRIALASEGAGGNLAIDTAIRARDGGLPAPVHKLLVHPVAGPDLNTPSYRQIESAVPLNEAAIVWYVDHFTRNPPDLQDPRLNVVGKADLHGLPPTTIVSAQIDPLRSEGEALAAKLQAAGVPVAQRTFRGVTHEFFGMGAVVEQARLAETFASDRLKASFAAAASLHRRVAHHVVSGT